MSASELAEHLHYHYDAAKVAAYRRALAEVVGPTATVLDLGAGTGLLGHLALEAGAAHVHAVDSGPILGLARQALEAAGFGDRVSAHRLMSTELTLDSPADVIICDQIGGFVHDAGVLKFFADAHERLAHDGTRYVPASFDFYCVPAQYDQVRHLIDGWDDPPSGLKMPHVRAHAANTEHYFEKIDDVSLLGPNVCVGSRASTDWSSAKMNGTTTIDRAGRLDGVVGFFTAHMSPSVVLTNNPADAARMDRWCNFYPVADAVDVSPGDEVSVQIDLRPSIPSVGWAIQIEGANGTYESPRHSTLLGAFMSTEDLAPKTIAVEDPMKKAVGHAVDLADGLRTLPEIVAEVWESHESAFEDRAHCSDVVSGLLRRLAG